VGIRGVLWDVGNVIVRWDPRTLYSKVFDDPAECDWFLTHVCTMAWHGETDRGRPMAQGIAELSAEFPKYADQIAMWRPRFTEMTSGAISETEQVMAELAATGIPQFGLTNMPVEVWPEVQALSPAFGLLADVVVSAEEGLVKPDPRIFHRACERFGMATEELLFIDDSPANIAAASALGFAVYRFADPAALRPAISVQGLL
jgi:FMN phosphatase YigB (HAD superfamily)